MMKKLFALLLAAVMLLGAGATALAAEPEGAGYVISIANSSTTNSLTVDLLTWEGMKNGRLELTYPEELTLVSAHSTLDAENGITDLDASGPSTSWPITAFIPCCCRRGRKSGPTPSQPCSIPF